LWVRPRAYPKGELFYVLHLGRLKPFSQTLG
jgi:hypothetical protein